RPATCTLEMISSFMIATPDQPLYDKIQACWERGDTSFLSAFEKILRDIEITEDILQDPGLLEMSMDKNSRLRLVNCSIDDLIIDSRTEMCCTQYLDRVKVYGPD
ncbi:MAG: hypothetical protein KJ574_01530, partial [Nanoarchaeota archaeon]|nr:hypothetical protein [Nanoarchaeota archaeon]